ncbi:uncharacterized protein LOC129369403 [Poeciliopsis prolifica]|uniref:uncharacterized protein LOC129369403 n=1 Tax=Poeciliopsis prolifica TaxID=188132 RepID=UPI0024136A80|nr:uncharacterized protein LOC129369403 [Poeciliopsis prolifica]
MAPQRIPQRFLDEQEKKKKAEMQKSLTAAWDDQVEYKRQNKIEMEKMKKQELHSLMESDRLHRLKEIEKKKEKQQRFSTQEKTKPIIREEIRRQREIFQSGNGPKEGFQSKLVQHKSESRFPELVPSPEDSKNVAHKKPVYHKVQETLPAAAPERSGSKSLVGRRMGHSADKPDVHAGHKPDVHFGYKPHVNSYRKPDVYSPEVEEMRSNDKLDVLSLEKPDGHPTHKHHRHSTEKHHRHSTHRHRVPCTRLYFGQNPHDVLWHRTDEHDGDPSHGHYVDPIDNHDDVKTSNPSLGHEKVGSTEPVKLPSLKSKTVRFHDNSPKSSKRVKFPSLP